MTMTFCRKETRLGKDPETPTYNPTSDRNGFAWHATYRLLTKRVGDQVRIYLQTTADARQITEIRDGEMLPIQEPQKVDLDTLLCKAVKTAKPDLLEIYRRPQLFVFAPGAEKEASRDYALDLIDAGLGEMHQATVIGIDECEHNITQEARALYVRMASRDRWMLKGPKVKMVETADDAIENTELEPEWFNIEEEPESEIAL